MKERIRGISAESNSVPPAENVENENHRRVKELKLHYDPGSVHFYLHKRLEVRRDLRSGP